MTKDPAPKLACCLCRRRLYDSKHGGPFLLDAEWLRRHPDMRGMFACASCVLKRHWWGIQHGKDALDHTQGQVDPTTIALWFPWSALLQGGEEWIRWAVTHPQSHPVYVQHWKSALTEWEATTQPETRLETPVSDAHDYFGNLIEQSTWTPRRKSR